MFNFIKQIITERKNKKCLKLINEYIEEKLLTIDNFIFTELFVYSVIIKNDIIYFSLALRDKRFFGIDYSKIIFSKNIQTKKLLSYKFYLTTRALYKNTKEQMVSFFNPHFLNLLSILEKYQKELNTATYIVLLKQEKYQFAENYKVSVIFVKEYEIQDDLIEFKTINENTISIKKGDTFFITKDDELNRAIIIELFLLNRKQLLKQYFLED